MSDGFVRAPLFILVLLPFPARFILLPFDSRHAHKFVHKTTESVHTHSDWKILMRLLLRTHRLHNLQKEHIFQLQLLPFKRYTASVSNDTYVEEISYKVLILNIQSLRALFVYNTVRSHQVIFKFSKGLFENSIYPTRLLPLFALHQINLKTRKTDVRPCLSETFAF